MKRAFHFPIKEVDLSFLLISTLHDRSGSSADHTPGRFLLLFFFFVVVVVCACTLRRATFRPLSSGDSFLIFFLSSFFSPFSCSVGCSQRTIHLQCEHVKKKKRKRVYEHAHPLTATRARRSSTAPSLSLSLSRHLTFPLTRPNRGKRQQQQQQLAGTQSSNAQIWTNPASCRGTG